MADHITVPASPCTSCPYRRDVPSGVWDRSEYEKLRGYDTNEQFGLFLCHQTTIAWHNMICRGWLTVHCESVAARLAVAQGRITNEQKYAPVKEPLYTSGNEAADAGLRGIRRPGKKARRVIERLTRARRRIKR